MQKAGTLVAPSPSLSSEAPRRVNGAEAGAWGARASSVCAHPQRCLPSAAVCQATHGQNGLRCRVYISIIRTSRMPHARV